MLDNYTKNEILNYLEQRLYDCENAQNYCLRRKNHKDAYDYAENVRIYQVIKDLVEKAIET